MEAFLLGPEGPGETPGVDDLLASTAMADGEDGFVPAALGTLDLVSSFFLDRDSASESVSSYNEKISQ